MPATQFFRRAKLQRFFDRPQIVLGQHLDLGGGLFASPSGIGVGKNAGLAAKLVADIFDTSLVVIGADFDFEVFESKLLVQSNQGLEF